MCCDFLRDVQKGKAQWFLLQNYMNIDETTLFSSKPFTHISAGPQKLQKVNALKTK
jgi:hypothetical protein